MIYKTMGQPSVTIKTVLNKSEQRNRRFEAPTLLFVSFLRARMALIDNIRQYC